MEISQISQPGFCLKKSHTRVSRDHGIHRFHSAALILRQLQTLASIAPHLGRFFSFESIRMSSGFVSGGISDQPIERDDEWHRVQQELEDERRRKADLGKQDRGKSLYEALQQNKSEFRPWMR